MTHDEQKELFKTAIKNAIPILHTERGKALDFVDKFNDAGQAFNELSPEVKIEIIKAFSTITAVNFPFQFNTNCSGF